MPEIDSNSEILSHLAEVVKTRSAYLFIGQGRSGKKRLLQVLLHVIHLVGDSAQAVCKHGSFDFTFVGTTNICFLSVPKELDFDIRDILDVDETVGEEFPYIIGNINPNTVKNLFYSIARDELEVCET